MAMRIASKSNRKSDRKLPENESKRRDKAIRKLDSLIQRYEMYRAFNCFDDTPEQINACMEELRTEAKKLQQIIMDEETKKKISDFVSSCIEAMHSHKIYIEQDQFIVLESFDAKNKFVLIDTPYGLGHNDYRVVACKYDDAIQNRESVLNNDYLTSVRVSKETYYEARRLIDKVRENSGESTLLYGRRELYATSAWVNYRVQSHVI